MLICLRHVFGQAKQEELIATNPCANVGFAIENSKQRGILTEEETRLLIDSAEVWPNTRDYLIAKISALTGMRQMEVVALKRKHILGKSAVLTILENGLRIEGAKEPCGFEKAPDRPVAERGDS